MKAESERTKLINGYLLGELSEEERARLEEQYFADAALSHEVQAARDELIDAYVRGELPRRERERFEEYFMASPRRRERVEFAAALLRSSSDAPAPAADAKHAHVSTPWWQSLFAWITGGQRAALAAAAVILISVVSWVALKSPSPSSGTGGGGPEDQVATVREGETPSPVTVPTQESPAGDLARDPAGAETASPPSPGEVRRPVPQPAPRIATFILTPGLRGAEAERLVIPRGTDAVLLRFAVEGEAYSTYRAQLRTPEGAEVWSEGRVTVRETRSGRTASLRVPSARLKSEDYILRVSGVTAEGDTVDVARFYLRTEKK